MALSCLQLDVTGCGGVTGFLQGASLAAASNRTSQVTAHRTCMPT